MSTEICHTLRASFADGRQAAVVDGRRKLVVRIFDESPEGFRVATIQPTMLVDGAETTLQLEGREIAVRVVSKETLGRRLVITLALLQPQQTTSHSPEGEKK